MKKRIAFLLIIAFITLTAFRPAEDPNDDYATCYVVFAGASTDFNALDATAKKISASTGIPYLNTLVFDPLRGMIEPDSSTDEIYAGSYYPRRFAEERISIEMADYYAGGIYPEASLRMEIVTGIYGSKKEAARNLAKVKKLVPDAYMKKVELYQGCMH